MIPKEFTTYAGWRKAAKDMGATRFEGDKDIAQAFAANGNHVGEWDGASGYVVGILRGQSRASRRLLRGGMPGEDTMVNPVDLSRWKPRVGDMVMGIMGVEGGYAGRVTGIQGSGSRAVVTYVDDDGVVHDTLAFNLTPNVPEKGKFPRKNPMPGEDTMVNPQNVHTLNSLLKKEGIPLQLNRGSGSFYYWRTKKGLPIPDAPTVDARLFSDATYDQIIELARDVVSAGYKGVVPPRMSNPMHPLPGESRSEFMARCMHEEKHKFPRQDQRVAVCMSKGRGNPLPSERPLYAEYLRELPGEEPFILGGRKWTFVKVRNADGREDIGVYSHDEDLAYDYGAWREMHNIGRGEPTLDPAIEELRRRRRSGGGSMTPEEA